MDGVWERQRYRCAADWLAFGGPADFQAKLFLRRVGCFNIKNRSVARNSFQTCRRHTNSRDWPSSRWMATTASRGVCSSRNGSLSPRFSFVPSCTSCAAASARDHGASARYVATTSEPHRGAVRNVVRCRTRRLDERSTLSHSVGGVADALPVHGRRLGLRRRRAARFILANVSLCG